MLGFHFDAIGTTLRKGKPSDQDTTAIGYMNNIVMFVAEIPTPAFQRDGERIARNTSDGYVLFLSKNQRSRQCVHPRLNHHCAPNGHLFARREDCLRVCNTHDLARRRRQRRWLCKPSRSVLPKARNWRSHKQRDQNHTRDSTTVVERPFRPRAPTRPRRPGKQAGRLAHYAIIRVVVRQIHSQGGVDLRYAATSTKQT